MTATPRILPGAVRQNGYVVRDLDAAVDGFRALGVGPFYVMRGIEMEEFRYHGEPGRPVLSIAFGNSGPLQIELIQQMNDAPSAYRDFIDSGREGFHHLAWWAEDYDAAFAVAVESGLEVAQDGGGGTKFAYFAADGITGTVLELSELNEGTKQFNAMVAASASEWDGVTDPVRSLQA